jgi:hypothetical protein
MATERLRNYEDIRTGSREIIAIVGREWNWLSTCPVVIFGVKFSICIN